MTTSTEQPDHELVDFVALAAQLTNEQKILACLERIEVLLTPTQLSMSQFVNKADLEDAKKAEHSSKIAALANKTMGRRK